MIKVWPLQEICEPIVHVTSSQLIFGCSSNDILGQGGAVLDGSPYAAAHHEGFLSGSHAVEGVGMALPCPLTPHPQHDDVEKLEEMLIRDGTLVNAQGVPMA